MNINKLKTTLLTIALFNLTTEGESVQCSASTFDMKYYLGAVALSQRSRQFKRERKNNN